MKIGEIAIRTGFSKDTIRYYEKIGLIHLNRKNRSSNNYRFYGLRHIEKLTQIKLLKNLGFTLKEIKTLFRFDEEGDVHCNSMNELVNKKVLTIEQKIEELNLVKSKLKIIKKRCTGDCRETLEI